MNIDWNWFFSAFAQCAAALIGIIAAFTISKLLSESEKVEDHSNAINEMHLFRLDLLRKIESRRFDWYDQRNIEYSYDLKESIENGEFDNLNEEDSLLKLKEIEPELFVVENCYRYLSEKISEVKAKLSPPPTTAYGVQIPTFDMPVMAPANLWDNLSKEFRGHHIYLQKSSGDKSSGDTIFIFKIPPHPAKVSPWLESLESSLPVIHITLPNGETGGNRPSFVTKITLSTST